MLMAPGLHTRGTSAMPKQPTLPPPETASSATVSISNTPTTDSESRNESQSYFSDPEPIPDELRDVAPLFYGFELTDDDVAAYERHHGLPETTGMERFARKLTMLGQHTRELDIWMRAFFDARAARRPRAPNASREDIIYFAKRTRSGHIMNFLCPAPELIEQLAQALCIARPVRWIPV